MARPPSVSEHDQESVGVAAAPSVSAYSQSSGPLDRKRLLGRVVSCFKNRRDEVCFRITTQHDVPSSDSPAELHEIEEPYTVQASLFRGSIFDTMMAAPQDVVGKYVSLCVASEKSPGEQGRVVAAFEVTRDEWPSIKPDPVAEVEVGSSVAMPPPGEVALLREELRATRSELEELKARACGGTTSSRPATPPLKEGPLTFYSAPRRLRVSVSAECLSQPFHPSTPRRGFRGLALMALP